MSLFFIVFMVFPVFVGAIIGGEFVDNPHEFPWMAYIQVYPLDHVKCSTITGLDHTRCGGSIINQNTILTAAHCVSEEKGKMEIFAILGHSDMSSNETIKVKIDSKFVHPNFKYSWKYDIALLKISEDLVFNEKIQPIDLPNENHTEDNLLKNYNIKIITAGWGKEMSNENFVELMMDTISFIKKDLIGEVVEIRGEEVEHFEMLVSEELRIPTKLKKIQLSTVLLCELFYKISAISNWSLGAFGSIDRGDSGGPLMEYDTINGKYQIVGISAAHYYLHGEFTRISSFTRVSSFVSWIRQNMQMTFIPTPINTCGPEYA